MNHIAIINTCDWGSTGKIAKGLTDFLNRNGANARFYYGRGKKSRYGEYRRFCYTAEIYLQAFLDKTKGSFYTSLQFPTNRLIRMLREWDTKEVYIINLHGHYLNEKRFLDYLIHDHIHVVYIMADESAFRGNCGGAESCLEYLNGCKNCPRRNWIQRSLWPRISNIGYQTKKHAYQLMGSTIFVGPKYVMKCVRDSQMIKDRFLLHLDEAIDINRYQPKDATMLRRELDIADNQIIIGCVAPFSVWYKGVKYFIELAKALESYSQYMFVHVGYDSRKKSNLPKNYVAVGYVKNQDLLAQFFSLFDLLVFPSLQDTMPNVCLEAMACGTPLMCFNTSGMPYLAGPDILTLVETGSIDQMKRIVLSTPHKDKAIIDKCRNYAVVRYDSQKYFARLMDAMKKTYEH